MSDGWELLERRRRRVLAGKPALDPDTSPRIRQIAPPEPRERARIQSMTSEPKAPPRTRPPKPADPRARVVAAVQRGIRSGDPFAVVNNVAGVLLDELARRIR